MHESTSRARNLGAGSARSSEPPASATAARVGTSADAIHDPGSALAVLEPLEAHPPAPHAPAHAERPSPAAVLAQLMDFPGGMKVAELLEAEPPSRERHPCASELGERLRRDVEARLTAVQTNVMAPLVGRRAPSLPTAEELYDAYRAAGLEAGRDDATLEKFSKLTGEPLLAAVAAGMHQAQLHTATLRAEIQEGLRQLGPRAERLERLDGALHVATQVQVRALFERMEASLVHTFAAACRHALASLPGEPSVDDFAAWVQPDGWLERFRTRCMGATLAVYTHLRRNVSELVRAAVFAEES